MRTTKASQAALLLGFGLGAFFEGILLHNLAGFFYLAAWAITVGGIVLLWSAVRGPGPLPSGRAFVGSYVVGWGGFNIVEALARHDLSRDWLLFGTGVGFVLLGVILRRMREDDILERRSGYDRRSASPLR
jgi:uncharacterized membrane protein